MSRRTVVTGIGVAAPNGLGAQEFWAASRAGRSGIGRISRFDAAQYPARLAGEVPGFDPREHLPSRLLPQTDRSTQLALAATDWALADAGADPADFPADEMAVVTAAGAGGFEFGQEELRNLWSKGSRYVSAYQSFAWFYAVNTGQISIRHGMKGPGAVTVSDQAGGLDAVAQARRQIRKGSRLAVTGGVEATVCPWGWVAQLAGGRMSRSDDPAAAYLPFDQRAAGHVAGEGGAILVLEEARSARERGARVYGEVAGYAATMDPAPGVGRPPGLVAAIRSALRDAAVRPAAVDVVFADGAGLPELDRVEAEAITEVFGRHGVPVTVPKTMTGRLLSGGAPLDLVSALLSIRDQILPPTTNVRPAPEYPLDLVTRARPVRVGTALVLARGQGGFNSAVVLTAPTTPDLTPTTGCDPSAVRDPVTRGT